MNERKNSASLKGRVINFNFHTSQNWPVSPGTQAQVKKVLLTALHVEPPAQGEETQGSKY